MIPSRSMSHIFPSTVSLLSVFIWFMILRLCAFLFPQVICDYHLLLVANMMHTSCHETDLFGAPYSLLAVSHCKICASIVFHSSQCTFCIPAWVCPNPLCQRWCRSIQTCQSSTSLASCSTDSISLMDCLRSLVIVLPFRWYCTIVSGSMRTFGFSFNFFKPIVAS